MQSSNRMESSTIWSILKKYFLEVGYSPSEKTYSVPGLEDVKEHYYFRKDNIYIVTPSYDSVNAIGSTAIPLNETLTILQEDANWEKAIIPICQSNNYIFTSIPKRHFTFLIITKDKDFIEVHHYDSKSIFTALIYSLEPIKKSIDNIFGREKVIFKSSYSNEQSLLDNKSCGLFIIKSIVKSINSDYNFYLVNRDDYPNTSNILMCTEDYYDTNINLLVDTDDGDYCIVEKTGSVANSPTALG